MSTDKGWTPIRIFDLKKGILRPKHMGMPHNPAEGRCAVVAENLTRRRCDKGGRRGRSLDLDAPRGGTHSG
jgi:hypothetical protein